MKGFKMLTFSWLRKTEHNEGIEGANARRANAENITLSVGFVGYL